MMLLLLLNVSNHLRAIRFADTEGAIASLPGECVSKFVNEWDILMPLGG